MPSDPMPRFAVLGQPVAHSLSPRIHRRFGEACGIALDYRAIELAPEALPARLAAFHAEGLSGANVTLPLKELAARACRELSDTARLSGAVNTLIRREDGWLGDNTDGAGLVADLHRLGVRLAGARVLLVGAGGAARGAVPALFDAGIGSLTVANRTAARAEALAHDLQSCGDIATCGFEALPGAGGFDLILNATSAARSGRALALPAALATAGTVAYDLSYGAAAEPFLAWAASIGIARAADGLGMLVEQAAESFQRWHGVRPETGPVLDELRAPGP
ncbi:MAG TPA: shikimate dehydrogenase [Chiayiivirga sp.]|nr:shikimate dehydrogenase [Chiayiivirga sp.]